jgi:hypothetical protein
MYVAKYVVLNGSVIIFSDAINHSDMIGYRQDATSAGFVSFRVFKDEDDFDVVEPHCYGESVSLGGLKSNPEEDQIKIRQQILNRY